jgi:phenylpropionate dioxygenase-like ring-hydroxylating dioxygenase large terminal subunit
MVSLTDVKIFGQKETVVEGWYWAIKSKDLKKGQTKPINFLGKELAIYRGQDNKVYAVDAYCPHMGAHLAEGKVDGNGIRCFFHHWKYDNEGNLVDIPCRKSVGLNAKITHYPVEEKYQTIWIYTGEEAKGEVHSIKELDGIPLDSSFGNQFIKGCHPNIMMINAIDAHHFSSVHELPVDVKFDTVVLSEQTIQFNNTTKIPQKKWYLRFISRFYANALTYSMSYSAGSTGSVTVGPDFLHCHIIFALRPTPEGKAEGLTILVTKKRKGLKRLLFSPVVLFATKCVGNYFAKGDTEVFKSIKFNFQNPIKEDKAIIDFIQHLEKQKCVDWGFGRKSS